VEHKNVQRRVYDALNVMMALGFVSKEKQGMVKFNEHIQIASEGYKGMVVFVLM